MPLRRPDVNGHVHRHGDGDLAHALDTRLAMLDDVALGLWRRWRDVGRRRHGREHRLERDLSQAALADALGVSRQTINAIETGKYDPSLPLAFRIARLFATSIEDVFYPEEDA